MTENKSESEFLHINPLIKDALNDLEIAANKPSRIGGLESGFHNLDKITGGWQKGELIVIGSRPAMGKTAFILSMAKNMAVNEKIPIGIFSLEFTNNQIVNRFITNVCEIPGEKIKNGQLASYEWEQLDFKIKELYNAPIYIDCPYDFSLQTICEKARDMVLEKGVKAIFIDYLQLLTVDAENRYNAVNYISRTLKSLAKELDIPILAVSQMNRGNEKREGAEGKRPQLTDLRDSGTLCEDADIVCFIHRPEYYRILEDEKGNSLIGLAEVIIAKQRNGATADVLLRFKSEFCRFQNIEDEYNSNDFPLKKMSDDNSNTIVPF